MPLRRVSIFSLPTRHLYRTTSRACMRLRTRHCRSTHSGYISGTCSALTNLTIRPPNSGYMYQDLSGPFATQQATGPHVPIQYMYVYVLCHCKMSLLIVGKQERTGRHGSEFGRRRDDVPDAIRDTSFGLAGWRWTRQGGPGSTQATMLGAWLQWAPVLDLQQSSPPPTREVRPGRQGDVPQLRR